DLGMPGARFEVRLETLDSIGRMGTESVEFMVSVNPGFPPRPLARVASGGELARVMLALKTSLAAVDEVPSLVFDEIDAGIGGTTANRVAEKLEQVAGAHQVFAITHLPQIAARADQHFRVEKEPGEEFAATRVDTLAAADRAAELARMLGGEPPSAASLRHARELLQGSGTSGQGSTNS
ncbi:MAG: DNA repair protein RecN, partial [Longimicrobiales bacterium]